MIKKIVILSVLTFMLVSCASWFSRSPTVEKDSPTIGSKDSSDFLFGEAAKNSLVDDKIGSSEQPVVTIEAKSK